MKEYDLNKIFPAIGRKSESRSEGRIYETLRRSPAPVILSGGQSGIDTAGLAAGSFLGLPAFAVMPRNGRREDGKTMEEIAARGNLNVRCLTLASESYRFRTWANVFFSDVTLLFDFVGMSEGSRAAIEACEYFKRPYFVLTETNDEQTRRAGRFLEENGPKVINIAGNSLSKIGPSVTEEAYNRLVSCLKYYCVMRKNPRGLRAGGGTWRGKPVIAVPNSSVCKNIFRDFVKKEYGAVIDFTKRLVYELEHFTLVTVRAREIIPMLETIDAGFVGADLCEEQSYTGEIWLDTGLIPNAMALISNKKCYRTGDRVCSQYPSIAGRCLHTENIYPISGSAEAYLSLHIYDSCVDTYQTGITAEQNRLHFIKKLKETSLVLVGGPQILESGFYAGFCRYLLS